MTQGENEGGTTPPRVAGGEQPLQTPAAKATETIEKRSPFMFLVIGVCFFLPFISLSCSGQRIATMSGVQLVTGADPKIDEQFAEDLEALGGETGEEADPIDDEAETNPSIWAIVALAAAVLGVVVGFVTRGRTRAAGSLTAAALGLAGLIGLRFDLQGDLSEAEGLISVDYRLGYWITALLFLVLAIAHGTFLRSQRQAGPPATGPPGPGP